MPFQRRTYTQLRDGALADIAATQIYDSETGEVINPLLLMFDPLTILAKLMAGLAYEEYGYLDYISLQSTPATATDEQALSWGGLKGCTLEPATAAQAVAGFSGTVNAPIPAGTVLSRSDGTTYATTADVVVGSGSTITAPITATVVGAAGTIAAGAALTVTAPIPGVSVNASVTASTAPGTDIETFDAFKARYLKVFRDPPAGGSLTDYEEWALAVPGITRAWTLGAVNGAGTVGVYIMLDVSEAANGGFPVGTNGVAAAETRDSPATGDQLTVANAIYPLRPVTALVYLLAPAPYPINFVISDLGTANTAANQADALARLQALFLALGDPRGQVLKSSTWEGALNGAFGGADFDLVSPTGPITVPVGSLPVVNAGNMTFNP